MAHEELRAAPWQDSCVQSGLRLSGFDAVMPDPRWVDTSVAPAVSGLVDQHRAVSWSGWLLDLHFLQCCLPLVL
jgi:hypothetical protein